MQFQRVIDECEKSYATKANIRNLFVALDAFAYDNDIILKPYSANLVVPEAAPKEGKLFTNDEIAKVWKDGDDVCKFLLFTGMRISEALELTPADVDLDEQLITCGLKTEAGKNRIVPIHPMIKDVVAAHMGGEVLFPSNGKKQTYKAYAKNRWGPMMESLGMEHHTHDCRKTFRSALDRAGANKVAVDRIIGHKSADVGERVYTLKTIDELREAILKLDYGLSVPLGK
jgi:integrase